MSIYKHSYEIHVKALRKTTELLGNGFLMSSNLKHNDGYCICRSSAGVMSSCVAVIVAYRTVTQYISLLFYVDDNRIPFQFTDNQLLDSQRIHQTTSGVTDRRHFEIAHDILTEEIMNYLRVLNRGSTRCTIRRAFRQRQMSRRHWHHNA